MEATGCGLRFLPAYLPDLNPIGQAFSKLKGWPRKLALGTVPDLVGWPAHLFDPDEFLNYFRNCGYT